MTDETPDYTTMSGDQRKRRYAQLARDLEVAGFRVTLGSGPRKGGWTQDGAAVSMIIPTGRKKRTYGVELILKSFLDKGMMPSSMTPIGRGRVRLFWHFGDHPPEQGELVAQHVR